MSQGNEPSSPIDLETLLPWAMNGTLTELEKARVGRALREGHLSEDSLEEVIRAHELANELPDTATLTKFAAGELSGDEARAVERYLRRPGAAVDRELVELARVALMDEVERSQAVSPEAVRHEAPLREAGLSAVGGSSFWRAWAMAASLLAVLLGAGWWMAARQAQSPDMAVAEVIELLPDDMVLRGAARESTTVDVGVAGLTLLLLIEKPVDGQLLSLSLRDASDAEIARVDAVGLRPDGSIHLFIEPGVAKRARHLILEGRGSEAEHPTKIHEYSFRPTR